MRKRKPNPQGLTKNQHIIPAASIKRFVSDTGLVQVWPPCPEKREIRRRRPKDDPFILDHAWGHGIEAGLMKRIEDRFQGVVERRLSRPSYDAFDPLENRIITDYHALCCLRARVAIDPPGDAEINGVPPEKRLAQAEQDILEKKGCLFAVGAVMPSRNLASLYVQMGIGRLHELNTQWALVFSRDIEFVVSERFGELNCLPVTPNYCLVANQPSGEISRSNALRMNAAAFSLPARFWFARSFTKALS